MPAKKISLRSKATDSQIDVRTRDLFAKCNKYGKNAETLEIFSYMIDDLLKIPKFTYKTLNNIVEDTKYVSSNKIHLKMIFETPTAFLNEHKQLLTFEQIIFVIETWKIKNISKQELIIAWI